uniref:Uncharacterized protein n=1 Tax=Chromera velia CCMP2878 TaxID=1169474 RepID=A0A0G4H950_9ALVE|eukprot:Cvel_25159.t1-p1 / transcript=Cvel_25159.t1 / gene=Cvel_25159 / organism=Chromera_velia_CCMP2878 / gene_product=hypothetical protein / transcript_product=hypothetical protein / location=Cvel_scaffold2815:636-2270(-) / protein_length=545 / sequence_SO=supercontig / SO=protein_coding / is_pseudo=false
MDRGGAYARVRERLDLWRQKHEEGLAEVRERLDTREVQAFGLNRGEPDGAHFLFRKIPSDDEAECPSCRCCDQSVQACARSWEEMLGVQAGSMEHYVPLKVKGNPDVSVGLGCAMEALFESFTAKYQSDLTLYWAHIVGVFGLWKAGEVAKYIAMGGRLKPRQEMEKRFPAVYLSVEEALQLLVASDFHRATIFALSYGWHSRDHPDPSGVTAKTVMEGMEGLKNGPAFHPYHARWVEDGRNEGERLYLEERGGKREKKEKEEDEESWMEKYFVRTSRNTLPKGTRTCGFPLFFQDFTSLPQWPRTEEEDARFKIGLWLLPVLYGNTSKYVTFLRCTEVPTTELEGVSNKTPYHKRGWTNFESRVASVKRKDCVIHLGPLFAQRPFEQLPSSPLAFLRVLEETRPEERSESNKEGFVVKFTNGLEDRPLVSELYRTFVLDTQVRGKKILNLQAKKYTIDTKEKGEMVGEYLAWMGQQSECVVEEVVLGHLQLNNDSLPPVAAGLRGFSKMRTLDLRWNQIGAACLFALKPLTQLKVCRCSFFLFD